MSFKNDAGDVLYVICGITAVIIFINRPQNVSEWYVVAFTVCYRRDQWHSRQCPCDFSSSERVYDGKVRVVYTIDLSSLIPPALFALLCPSLSFPFFLFLSPSPSLISSFEHLFAFIFDVSYYRIVHKLTNTSRDLSIFDIEYINDTFLHLV